MKAAFLYFVVYASTLSFSANGAAINEEVYNGTDAVLGQFPYDVNLLPVDDMGRAFGCGGSLISTKYVLTAAHCCEGINFTLVYMGLVDRAGSQYLQSRSVTHDNFIIHPEWNTNTLVNDIAILRLPSPMSLNQYVQTIALPSSNMASPNYFSSRLATVSGWGQTYDDEAGGHQQLQYATVYMMRHKKCQEHFATVVRTNITDGMICAGKKIIYAGSCEGDSGSPLIVNGTDGKPMQIGLVSWGFGECSSDNPGVYTNVAAYVKWIGKATGIRVN